MIEDRESIVDDNERRYLTRGQGKTRGASKAHTDDPKVRRPAGRGCYSGRLYRRVVGDFPPQLLRPEARHSAGV